MDIRANTFLLRLIIKDFRSEFLVPDNAYSFKRSDVSSASTVINIFRFKKRTHAEYDMSFMEVKVPDKRR